jgi:hypothetical protein
MSASRYRKKPVVIEAVQVRPVGNLAGEPTEAMAFIKAGETGCTWDADRQLLYLPTLEGRMEAQPGDYIIKGVKGEFYPIKESIFGETYEPVGEA